jgi:hypothetical protein
MDGSKTAIYDGGDERAQKGSDASSHAISAALFGTATGSTLCVCGVVRSARRAVRV